MDAPSLVSRGDSFNIQKKSIGSKLPSMRAGSTTIKTVIMSGAEQFSLKDVNSVVNKMKNVQNTYKMDPEYNRHASQLVSSN